MSPRLALTVLLAAATSIVEAQVTRLDIEPSGRLEFKIGIDAKGARALDVFSMLAEKSGFALSTGGGPDVVRALDGETLDLAFSNRTFDQTIQELAAALGFVGALDREERIIHIAPFPADTAPEAFEGRRRDAINRLLAAYGGDQNSQREEKLLLASADLHVAGGDYAEALDTLNKYVSDYPGQTKTASEACLMAARCALEVDRPDDAIAMSDKFIDLWPRHPALGQARILRARALAMKNDVLGAMAMLQSMVGSSRRGEFDDRDRLVAELILAELHYRHGRADDAVAVLEETAFRHSGESNRDLHSQVPLFLGLARRKAGQSNEALRDLELAALTAPNEEVRAWALQEQASTRLNLGAVFAAMAALRVALNLEVGDATRVGLRRMLAESYREIGLHTRALDEVLSTVESLPGLRLGTADRVRLTTQILDDVGRLTFELGDWERALDAFRRLIAVHGPNPRIEFMIGRCLYRAGRHQEAIRHVQELRSRVDDITLATDLRRLEGDCYEALGLYEQALRTWREADR